MTLEELKSRLRITGNEDDAYLQELLDDAVSFVLRWTNNEFGGKFPADVKRAVSRLVALERQSEKTVIEGAAGEVKTVKIDGLSKTYATSAESAGSWEQYLNMPSSPFNVLKLYRRMKFTSSGLQRDCRR